MPMVMEGSDGVEALWMAIPGERPEGSFDPEDALYLSIDLEMIKLGGLHESGLDWTRVETDCDRYLRQGSKHFRVVAHLINAWLRDRQWDSWVQAARLLAGMVQHHWIAGFPHAGADGMTAKRRQLAATGQRLLQSLPTLDVSSHCDRMASLASDAVDALEAAERSHGITPPLSVALRQSMLRAVEAATQAPFQPPRPLRQAGTLPQGDRLGEAFFGASCELSLGSEREIRTVCLKLADVINQQDAFDPTGYLLRRRALWSAVHGTPPARQDGRTEMMNVPADIRTGYQQALAGSAVSLALLQRIEKSVAASPYWLRGSFLAATVATRLQMPVVAIAIRTAASRFLQRLPMLREISFSDGAAFIDQDVLAWMSMPEVDGVASRSIETLAALRDQVLEQQQDGQHIESILLGLQARQADRGAPRERHYASVAAADLLHERGLTWIAQDLYAGVAQAMASQRASEWDPELFNHAVSRDGRSESP